MFLNQIKEVCKCTGFWIGLFLLFRSSLQLLLISVFFPGRLFLKPYPNLEETFNFHLQSLWQKQNIIKPHFLMLSTKNITQSIFKGD